MNKTFAKQLNLDKIYFVENTYDEQVLLEGSKSHNQSHDGVTYVVFDGPSYLDQLRVPPSRYDYTKRMYVNPEMDVNLTEAPNSITEVRLQGVGSSKSTQSRSYSGIKAEVKIGNLTKTVHLNINTLNNLLEEATIKKGVIKEECLFVPPLEDGKFSDQLILKGGKEHKKLLKEIESYQSVSSLSASKIPTGALLPNGHLILGKCYCPSLSVDISEKGTLKSIKSKNNMVAVSLTSYFRNHTPAIMKELLESRFPDKPIWRNHNKDFNTDIGGYPNHMYYGDHSLINKITYTGEEPRFQNIFTDIPTYMKNNSKEINSCLLSRYNWSYNVHSHTFYNISSFLSSNKFFFKEKEDIKWFSEKVKSIISDSSGEISFSETEANKILHAYTVDYLEVKLKIPSNIIGELYYNGRRGTDHTYLSIRPTTYLLT